VSASGVIAVTGPPFAGVTSLAAALRERLPGHPVVEVADAADLPAGCAAAAVVFAVSAVAPMTASDCALLHATARHTDLVVGVVTKTDAHRGWREVLAADRAAAAQHAVRYTGMQWVGAAAAPDVGTPCVDGLVGLLRGRLEDPDTVRRNRLRAREHLLETTVARHRADGVGADRQARVAALRLRRDEVRRAHRRMTAECSLALRSRLQQARVQLTSYARTRCASLRGELQGDVAELRGHRRDAFVDAARQRAREVGAEVDARITAQLADVAAGVDLTPPAPAAPPDVEVPAPPVRSRRLETQLMVLLGVGFGMGVALTVWRLLAGLVPGLAAAGAAAGAVAGLLLTMWVVGIRGLLAERAGLDRWAADVTIALRSACEERVAARVLTAETVLTTELSARAEDRAATAAQQIGDIDAELRRHAIATAHAAAIRDRELPALLAALDDVRRALDGEPTEAVGTAGI
jgi:hypothetical protein